MSWDKMRDDLYRGQCACGKGYVEFKRLIEADDWNRYREHDYDEMICCPDCSEIYHIESEAYHYYRHKGDEGTVVTKYLVPIGKTINQVCSVTLPVLAFDEQIVADYSVASLKVAVEQMKVSRYSTRVQDDVAKDIIYRYSKRYKRTGLPVIIEILEQIIKYYDKYEWTKEKYEKQKKIVADNQKIINKANKEAKSCSYKLSFKKI